MIELGGSHKSHSHAKEWTQLIEHPHEKKRKKKAPGPF